MREIAMAAAFIAMVFLSTSLFYIALISSTGFFNIGEAFIYLAALIGGPIVGALAGGIGAAMADMVLGYGVYAPGTLIFKGLEGFTVGFLYQTGRRIDQKIRLVIISAITLFLLAFSIYITTPALNGIADSSVIQIRIRILDFSLIIPHILGSLEDTYKYLEFEIHGLFIIAVALLFSAIIWFIELRMGEKGQMVLSCLLAGPIIVIGYFLYQIMLLEVPFAGALSEVPFNIAQVVFGIVIAVPIVSYLREFGIIPPVKELPSSKEKVTEKETTIE